MTREIERKYVPTAIPDEIAAQAGKHLRQGYIAEDGDVSVRVRITSAAAVLTIKTGAGLTRTEVELELSTDQADALWPTTAGRRIDKTRHLVPLPDGNVAEIDLYHGDLDGLCTIEVEFDSEDAAASFTPPAWFGTDVTGIAAWTNAALSRHGRPAQP